MSKMTRGEPYLCDHLNGCARCHGEGHDNLTALPLDHPIDFEDGFVATHWCPCPTNGQPILWSTGPKPNPDVVPFRQDDVKAYLDEVIAEWRELRDAGGENCLLAPCYIDAFQSVRTSLFDALLPAPEGSA